MEWAKLCSSAKFNLATSGMVSLPLAELDVKINQLEINGPSIYGYEPLLKDIAARYRVPQECVVSAIGTSMANYLALAAVTEHGDEIVMEQPGYDPMSGAAQYLGLNVRFFERSVDQNFAIDLARLEQAITARTRVIVLTNLHNPSGAFSPDGALSEVARIACKVGAYILLDEVYREMLFEAQPQTGFHLDPERFLITNSLTKAYGLSGLRCGWVLAPPEIAQRIWHINDVHGSTFTHPGELLSVIAFDKLTQISARMKSLLDTNRNFLREFLSSRDDLDYYWPEYGTIVFPRLKQGNVKALCDLLRNQFETSVVPGSFFGMPNHFRIGVGSPTEDVRAALQALGKGLDHFKVASNH
jgi:aspartate/methionine/tyrosine aminotransferase